jgi:NADH-quinone oxidoreductase subunit L
MIIEAARFATERESATWVNQYAYWAVLLGAFVTSFYSFRLLYLTFHGRERFRDAAPSDAHHNVDTHSEGAHTLHEPLHDDGDGHHDHHGPVEPHESPWVVTLPLILLAIPSVLAGFFTAGPMLFGTDWTGHSKQWPFFLGAIDVPSARDVIAHIGAEDWHGPVQLALHGVLAPAFWLTFAGFALATIMYLWKPELATRARHAFAWPVRVLENKYGFDNLWIDGFAGGGIGLGRLSRMFDSAVVDGVAVNGSARLVDVVARLSRRLQSGYLYHYAFAMIVGLIVLLAFLIRGWH